MPPRAGAIAGVLALTVTATLHAPDKPTPPVGVLVFTRTAGFRHDSIPAAAKAIGALACNHGSGHGLRVIATEDAGVFTDARLSSFDVVVFLSTTGDVLNDEQQAAFKRYIEAGGGYVGVHAAADTEYDWPWYGRLVGAYFQSHPPGIHRAMVLVSDRVHPSTKMLPQQWPRRDEWYNYRARPASTVRVLASLDETTYEGGSMGNDHPIVWCHEFDGGRAWYTGGGHTIESWAEPLFLEHLLGGILWAADRVHP